MSLLVSSAAGPTMANANDERGYDVSPPKARCLLCRACFDYAYLAKPDDASAIEGILTHNCEDDTNKEVAARPPSVPLEHPPNTPVSPQSFSGEAQGHPQARGMLQSSTELFDFALDQIIYRDTGELKPFTSRALAAVEVAEATGNPDAKMLRGIIIMNLPGQSIKHFGAALKSKSKHPLLQYYLGECYRLGTQGVSVLPNRACLLYTRAIAGVLLIFIYLSLRYTKLENYCLPPPRLPAPTALNCFSFLCFLYFPSYV